MDSKFVPLSQTELETVEGGIIPPVVVGICLVGGFFVAGICIGVAAGYCAYKLTHL